jgi:uncharacterized protein YqjF (DUF2071 family)
MHPFMITRWVNLGIFTFAVPPRLLLRHVPRGLELDLLDGDAFVSLVAFDFRDTRVLGVRWPGYVNFPELNLRTYVRRGEQRGVVFLREHVSLRLVSWIARVFFNENYRIAPLTSLAHKTTDSLEMEGELTGPQRAHRVAIAGCLPATLPQANSPEHYFMELRWGFGSDRHGQTICYEVCHPPWEIYPVRSSALDLDWGQVYGPEWRFLNGAEPFCKVLAAGSEVLVYPSVHRNGRTASSCTASRAMPRLNGAAAGLKCHRLHGIVPETPVLPREYPAGKTVQTQQQGF